MESFIHPFLKEYLKLSVDDYKIEDKISFQEIGSRYSSHLDGLASCRIMAPLSSLRSTPWRRNHENRIQIILEMQLSSKKSDFKYRFLKYLNAVTSQIFDDEKFFPCELPVMIVFFEKIFKDFGKKMSSCSKLDHDTPICSQEKIMAQKIKHPGYFILT